MGKSDAEGPQNQAAECRFSLKQYMMLKRCSEKKDITAWNEWRKANPGQKILLEGADLREAHLAGADLYGAHLEGADLEKAHLEGADLGEAHLEGAGLGGAHLEGADLDLAHLQGAEFYGAHLAGGHLRWAHLEGAGLLTAHLEGAELNGARLAGADLVGVHLEGAALPEAHLEGADLSLAHLEGADFLMAAVDGNTLISRCRIDRATNFSGVGLDSARVEPGLKQLLQYNVRRIRWRAWYKQGNPVVRPLKKAFVQPFWWTCDYGRSTKRILGVFLALALAFAIIYRCFPSCLEANGGELKGFLHAFYFSVVTMTTLGFGDIHASPGSAPGQVLLMVQVILGYVLLGALVTRFAVLFQAGGPSAKFPDEGLWKKLRPLLVPYAERAQRSFCAENRIGRPVLDYALLLRARLRNWRRGRAA